MGYPIISSIAKPYLSITRIHPLKQKQLEELIAHVEENFPEVKYIAVFGSTVDGRCRPSSDIDICVWGGKDCHFYTIPNDVYDVIFAEDVIPGSPIEDQIDKEGWVIYAKPVTEESKV